MAGGSTSASAGFPGLPPAGQSSTSNTSAGKGPGQPLDQMKTSDGRSFSDATGKSPGQPQVQPSQTQTSVAPGGTTGIDPNLYNPMAPQVQKPLYPNMGYPAFDPMRMQIGAPPTGMSPYANQFAQGQTNLAGLGQMIGLPPGPGGQTMNPPALGLPPGVGPGAPAGTPVGGGIPAGAPVNQTAPTAPATTTATTAATPQTQPMNPNRQREMDEHDMRGNRVDNDNDEMRRRGMGYGNRMDNDNDMQRHMGRGPNMQRPQPGIAGLGLSPTERMKRMQ